VLGLSLAALFIVLNGFFVAAEFALVKLRATRGGSRSQAPGWREDVVRDAVARLDRYLGVTQLGITLCSLGLGWIGEPAVAELGNRVVIAITGQELGGTGRAVVFGVAFAVLTLFHVLFGELVPKLVAIQRSNDAALVTIPLLRAVHLVTLPALWVLDLASRTVLKLIGLPFDDYSEAALSEEEIVGILAANVTRGPRGEQKHELLRRVMRFSSRTAKSTMIPRVDVAALPLATEGDEAIEFVRQQQYSRVLLLKGTSLDDVVGYLYAKDLVFAPGANALPNLESIRRDVLFVPETQELMDVLRSMQRTHTPFAVVVDEYGGTSGIITMEDLLEEIVGQISDELDVEATRIERKGDVWEVDGRVTLDELSTIGLEPSGEDRSTSLGAVVMARLKRLPRVGDRVEIGGMSAEVMAIARRRVTRVRVRRDEETATPP
jgi:CBS domain containing-hemolysin-like protein